MECPRSGYEDQVMWDSVTHAMVGFYPIGRENGVRISNKEILELVYRLFCY